MEKLDKGLASRGYKPSSGERSFVGFVKNNVSIEKETLYTKSPKFNSVNGDVPSHFKRF